MKRIQLNFRNENTAAKLTLYLSIFAIFSYIFILIAPIAFKEKEVAGVFTTPLAFPGASGYGKNTIGGRGGVVCKVTNLNNSGAGSFRTCAEGSGSRIVIFEVGGVITLSSAITITNPFITIAGQTSPGDGIVLRNFGINITTHDVIIRYIRIRVAHPSDTNSDALQIGLYSSNPIYNIIVDHSSLSWHEDEGFSLAGPNIYNITFSWNIISESLGAGHGIFVNSTVPGSAPTKFTVHHNLLAHNGIRNPLLSGESDFINNIIYNDLGQQAIEATLSAYHLNFMNNYYLPGPDTNLADGGLGNTIWKNLNFRYGSYGASSSLFVDSNISVNRYNNSLPNTDFYTTSDGTFSILSSPSNLDPSIIYTDAFQAYDDVLSGAGATKPLRDSTDTRVINTVKTQTGQEIDSISEIGGFPSYSSGTAPADGDNDGMPDSWETLYGFNPVLSSDNVTDADGDGYTNIEEYLNSTYPVSNLNGNISQNNWIFQAVNNSFIGNGQYNSISGISAANSANLTLPFINSEMIQNAKFDNNVSSWDLIIEDISGLPTSVSGLKLWYKPETLSDITDGGQVQNWPDSSDQNNTATQSAAGSRPTLHTNRVAGYSTLDFDSTSDFLNFNTLTLNDLTLLLVHKPRAFTFNAFLGRNSGTSAIMQYDQNTITLLDSDSHSVAIDSSNFPTTYNLQTIKISGGTVYEYIDGPQAATGGGSLTTFILNQLGSWGGGGSQYLYDGEIVEVLLYDSAISDVDKESLERYLSSKYNIGNSHTTTSALNTSVKYGYTKGSVKVSTLTTSKLIQNINAGTSKKFYYEAYAYTDGSPVTSNDVTLYYDGSNISATYTAMYGGWYKLSAVIQSSTQAKQIGFEVKANKAVYIDEVSLKRYQDFGSITSAVFDTNIRSLWGTINYSSILPVSTSAQFKMRSSNSVTMSGAPDFASCNSITNVTDISGNNCTHDGDRYLQYQILLSTSDTTQTPSFQSLSLNYNPDNISPTGAININQSAEFANSLGVNLALNASDNLDDVTVLQMQVSDVSNFSGASWESFVVSKALDLCTSEGAKIIYIKFKDTLNNESPSYSDTIICDSSIEKVSELSLDGNLEGSNPTIRNSLPTFRFKTINDSISGISKYQIFKIIDNIETILIDNITDVTEFITKELPEDKMLSDGTYQWFVRAFDNAGNINESDYYTFSLDTTAPTITVTTINLDINLSYTSASEYKYIADKGSTLTVNGQLNELGSITLNIINKLTNDVYKTCSSSFELTWSCITTGIEIGIYKVEITAIDQAGNESGKVRFDYRREATEVLEFISQVTNISKETLNLPDSVLTLPEKILDVPRNLFKGIIAYVSKNNPQNITNDSIDLLMALLTGGSIVILTSLITIKRLKNRK